jgi:hypothetical protein
MLQKHDKILFYFSVVLVHLGFKIALDGVDGIYLGIGCSPKMQFTCLLHVMIKCTMVISYVPNLFPQESDELTYKTFESLEVHSMVEL